MSVSDTRTKTLVLDLDKCLITSFFNNKDEDGDMLDSSIATSKIVSDLKNQDLRNRFYRIKLKKEEFCGARREGLDAFLSFAFTYFKYVIVWSAGDREYVHAIVNEIFRGHHKPHYVFTRDDLVYAEDEDYHKPLSVIEAKYPGIAPPTKTIFIDDREDNFRENPGNGFTIPQCNIYTQDDSIVTKKDTALHSLMHWLNRKEVVSARDVTKLDKKNVFTYTSTSPLQHTPSHVMFYAPITHTAK